MRLAGFGFRLLRFRMLDHLQGGVDRGSELLDVACDQVGAELSLGVLVQLSMNACWGACSGAGSLRQPDQRA